MPRYSDVPVTDVLAAIRQLREAGQPETMVAVQRIVGRGSIAVIRRLMIMAYEHLAEEDPGAVCPLPPPVKPSALSKRAARRDRNAKAMLEIERRDRIITQLREQNAELMAELAAAVEREQKLAARLAALAGD